uniref:RING-type domain-containing protein n=1 Tax=Gallus gallus TaxID=9031 RepID=A0A8V0Y9J0_CHICK
MRKKEFKIRSYGSEETGSASQLQQAGPCQAADNRCPICLDAICHAAHVPTCFHCFCFSCIWQWARSLAEFLTDWRARKSPAS